MTETRVICDKCKEEIKPEVRYFKVDDWMNVTEYSETPTQHLDICSQGCLVKLLDGKLAQPRTVFEVVKIIPAKI